MLGFLIRFSIHHSGFVIAVAFLLLGYSSYRFNQVGLDIFPEFSPNQVTVQTESPGLSAEQVELRVTQPIENAISGLIGMQSVRSESIQGLSIITAIFSDQTDIYRARQLISERLMQLENQLPATANNPIVIPHSSSSATVLTIGLSSKSNKLMSLRSLVDWTIVPRLLAVPGVADVNVFGGDIKQLQIQFNPAQLRRYNLSVTDVIHAAKNAGGMQGTGFIENLNQRFTIHITGRPTHPDALKKIIVKRGQNFNITLGEVSDIRYAAKPPIGAAQIMGQEGIVMMVIGQYGANTLTVTHSLEKTLAEFKAIFAQQDIQFYPQLFRPADYIESSFANITGHLLIGGFFVLIILYCFLYNIRTAIISALAVPLSLMGAILVLLEAGVNLNIMVLGGLAIALGEVVDDAIIDTENIFRRLRENRLLAQPEPRNKIVYKASMEVRNSVVYASFIVVMVFIPLLTLSGIAGRLFSPLGLSYIIAIFASLCVAITVTPALCNVLLKRQSQLDKHPPLLLWLSPLYRKTLILIARYFKTTAIISLVLLLLCLIPMNHIGSNFLPKLREGHYIIHTTSLPGTSLNESIRTGIQLTRQFLKIKGVESVSQWAGRAERGADSYGSHYSEYEIRLKKSSGYEQDQILEQLRQILHRFPGIVYEANTFLTERIDETISGYTSPIVINIYGEDLNTLDRKAQQVAAIMRTIAGAEDVQLRSPTGTSLINIHLNLDQLALNGVQPNQVLETIKTAYEGQTTGKIFQGNRFHDLVVTLDPNLKKQPDIIGKLPIRTLDGTLIQLDQLADINHREGRYNILHQNAQRKQTITCNVKHRDIESFVNELKNRVKQEVSFAANYYPEYTGAVFEQTQARKELILHAMLAGAGVLLLIYMAVGNFYHTLLALANLPFSLVGGIAAIMLTGANLSIGSMVGFITLFGITVRNSIMLLSHYQNLINQGKCWNLETAILGAQERLPSILMTALVTALAMLPIAFDSNHPGLEIMSPMATIIIGGLASSTLLNLLLLPVMLLNFGKFYKQES